jgi:hypothetical protein
VLLVAAELEDEDDESVIGEDREDGSGLEVVEI